MAAPQSLTREKLASILDYGGRRRPALELAEGKGRIAAKCRRSDGRLTLPPVCHISRIVGAVPLGREHFWRLLLAEKYGTSPSQAMKYVRDEL